MGDYIVDGALRVERKTFDDFQVSLIDGRLFGQANRLCRTVEPAAIVLEGYRSRRRTGVGRRQLQGALLVLSLVFDLPVFRARDAEETVWLLKAISRQARRRVAHGLASRHGNPRDLQARRLHLFASCPGIGPGRAERLLEHFGSLTRVFAASEADLLEVRGVGAKTARILAAFATHDVRCDGKRTRIARRKFSGMSSRRPSRVRQPPSASGTRIALRRRAWGPRETRPLC